MNNLNNSDNSEENFQVLLQEFEKIHKIDDLVEQKFVLIKSAKNQGIDFNEYHRLFEEYQRNLKKNKYPIFSFDGLCVRTEITLEKLADALSHMAIFQVLEYLGKFSIVLAAIVFIWEIPTRIDQEELAQKRTHYEAWSVVNNGIKKSASLGRKEALEFLNKKGDKLSGLDIQDAVLEELTLPKATLKLSKMNRSDLIKSDFTEATLDYADFSDAYLWNSKFNAAALSRANFSGAELNDVELKKADILCAKFLGSKNLTFEQLKEANNWASAVYDPEFQKYLLEEIKNNKNNGFSDTKINDLIDRLRPKSEPNRSAINELKKADKTESLNLVCAEFAKEDLSGLDLSGADLSYAILKNTDLRNTKLINAKLTGANLDGVNFTGTDIEGANLEKVKSLTKAQIKKAKNWDKAKFDPAWEKILFGK